MPQKVHPLQSSKNVTTSLNSHEREGRCSMFVMPVQVLFERYGGEGCTALHFAVRRGDVALVNCLLQEGADPSITNKMGFSPIDFACMYPEIRGGLVRVRENYDRETKHGSRLLHRRSSTATEIQFPMYVFLSIASGKHPSSTLTYYSFSFVSLETGILSHSINFNSCTERFCKIWYTWWSVMLTACNGMWTNLDCDITFRERYERISYRFDRYGLFNVRLAFRTIS